MAKEIQGIKTAKIALVVAALLLLVLVVTKYTEFLEKRLERGVIAKQEATAVEQATIEAKIDERFQLLETTLASRPAPPPIDPLMKDQEVMALRRELQAVQEERAVMDDKIDEINRQERIMALGGAPLPDTEATLTQEQKSIERAAAIASVTAYNTEWGFVMLDGGSSRGLTPGTRLGVRRGADVVTLLEISDVEAETCVASLVRGGPGGRGNAIPQQGDKVIAWPPF